MGFLCCVLNCSGTIPFLAPNTWLSILLADTFNLYASLKIRAVFHDYEKTMVKLLLECPVIHSLKMGVMIDDLVHNKHVYRVC
jgi:hypothetical protein